MVLTDDDWATVGAEVVDAALEGPAVDDEIEAAVVKPAIVDDQECKSITSLLCKQTVASRLTWCCE